MRVSIFKNRILLRVFIDIHNSAISLLRRVTWKGWGRGLASQSTKKKFKFSQTISNTFDSRLTCLFGCTKKRIPVLLCKSIASYMWAKFRKKITKIWKYYLCYQPAPVFFYSTSNHFRVLLSWTAVFFFFRNLLLLNVFFNFKFSFAEFSRPTAAHAVFFLKKRRYEAQKIFIKKFHLFIFIAVTLLCSAPSWNISVWNMTTRFKKFLMRSCYCFHHAERSIVVASCYLRMYRAYLPYRAG